MHHTSQAPSSNLPLYTWTAFSCQYNTEATAMKKSYFIQSEIYKQFSVSNLRLSLWIIAVWLPMQQPNSCIFQPCDLLPTFPLLHIPGLHFWPYRIFHSRIFSRPFIAYANKSYRSYIRCVGSLFTDEVLRWASDECCWCRMETDVADVNAILAYDGLVHWIPPVNYLVRCQYEDDDITSCSLRSV